MSFKELSFKKKCGYIYDYYRFYFYAFLFLLFMLIYFVAPVITNLKSDTVLQLAIVNADFDKRASTVDLEEDLLNEIGTNSEYDRVIIDTSKTTIETMDSEAALTIAFSVAGGNDIVICDEETYKKYNEHDFFQDWDLFLSEEEEEKYSQYIEGNKLLLDNSQKWSDYGYTTYSPVYAVILHKTQNADNISSFVSLMFD